MTSEGSTMPCDGVRSRILEYLDGELAGSAQAELEAHLSHCPGCREELQDLQATLALIARMPAPEPSEAFWQQYLREIRQKATPASRAPRLRNWLAVLWLRPVPALAVAIVLTLAAFFIWTIRPDRPPMPELASLDLTQQLEMNEDLDVLREMDLLEEIELLEDWDLIRSRAVQGLRRAV